MSGAIIGALRAVLSFESAAFDKGLKKAASDLGAFETRMKTIGSNISKAGAALSLMGAGVALAIRGQVNAADDMSKAAQKFGIPIETLSRLSHAADLSDVSMQSMGVAVGKLSKQMVAAKNGNKAAAALFEGLGVAVTDAGGAMRPTEDVLMDLSDVIGRIPDGAEKTALAMSLLGRSGAELIPLMNGGGQAIKDMMTEAEALGLTISQETGKAAEEFNDNLTRLQSTLTGVANKVMTALLPALSGLAEWVLKASTYFRDLSPETQKWLAIAAGITVVLGPVLIGFGLVVTALGAIAGGFGALYAVMLANPFVLIGAAIVAVVVLIYQNWEPIRAFFAALWADILTRAQAAIDAVKQAWTDASAWFGGLVTDIGTFFVDLWADVSAGTIAAVDAVKAAWVDTVQWFSGLMDLIKQTFVDGWARIKAVAAGWADDFIQFGRDIIEGLRLGIEQKWNEFVAYFQQKAQDIKDVFTSALDFGSPSGVFRQFGQWIMQGLGLGIKENMPVVTDAMVGVSDAISGSGASLSAGISDFAGSVKEVFKGIVTGSMNARDAVASLVAKLADMATNALFDTLIKSMGGAFGGLLGAANGAVMSRGRMTAFSAGGIVNGPTLFPMRNGTGLMGEAGPEAIMPLTRIGGRLGVRAISPAAAPAVNVNPQIINVLDPSVVGEYLATRAGERQILNVMRRSGVQV